MKVRKNLVIIAAACAVILAMGVNASTSVESQHERRIQVLETQVRSLLRRVETLEKDRPAAKSPTKRRETSAPVPTYPQRFGPGLQVGQIAYLGNSARVLQVVDGENMLVEIKILPRPREFKGITESKVTWPEVKGPLTAAMKEARGFTPSKAPADTFITTVEETVWVKGIRTTGLVDEGGLDIKVPLEITGTQSYTTLSGQTTVFLLEPLKK
jgi:hypothetical protein